MTGTKSNKTSGVDESGVAGRDRRLSVSCKKDANENTLHLDLPLLNSL